MAEGEQHRLPFALVVPVSNEKSFVVGHLSVIAAVVQIGGIILDTQRESLRQMSGRIDLTGKHVHSGLSHSLASEIGLNHSFRQTDPRHLDRRSVM